MGKLSGKVALLTGASKGIGAAIAESLGAAGAAVAVNYASEKAGTERVVEKGGLPAKLDLELGTDTQFQSLHGDGSFEALVVHARQRAEASKQPK